MWVIILISAFEGFLSPEAFFKKNYNFPEILLGRQRGFEFGLERRFNLTELDRQDFILHYNNFDLRFSHFGRLPYQEYLLGMGLTYPVKSYLGFGLGIDGLINRIDGYGSDGVYIISTGIEFNFQALHLVSVIKNINAPQLESGDSVPPLGSIAVEVEASTRVGLLFNFQSTVPFEPVINAGTRIRPNRLCEIDLGLRSEPLSLLYGLKILAGRLELKYLGDLHQQLGPSHRFGLGITI